MQLNSALDSAADPSGSGSPAFNHSATYLLFHESRHVGFQIVMQISHVICWGANIGKTANCVKSARRNIEITLQKVHFSI